MLSAELVSKINEVVEKCIECKQGCRSECEFLTQFCDSPKEIMQQILKEPEANVDLPYFCNLCTTCTIYCPQGFNFAEIFLQIRCELVEEERGPLKEHSPVTSFHQPLGATSLFTLTQENNKAEETKRVFLPGCSFSAYDPKLVSKAYEYLQQKIPDIGFILRCCGNPTGMLGQEDKFEKKFENLIAEVESLGATEIICACPNCTDNIGNNVSEEIKVTSLYEILAEIGVPEERKNIIKDKVISIHDSCTVREYSEIHDSVRKIAADLGLEVQEIEHNRAKTRCCGFGGMVVPANPELATKIMKRRVAEIDKEVVTYCATCREAMVRADKSAFHILEFVFSDDWQTGARPVYNSVKQWFNRWRTKRKVKKLSKGEKS